MVCLLTFTDPSRGRPRKQGNSVFVDENFEPYADQWGILSQLGKLDEDLVKQFIYERTA